MVIVRLFMLDYVRVFVLVSILGILVWSALPEGGKPVIGAQKSAVGGHDGVRKLTPDFTVCGEGSVRTPAYEDEKRAKCSAVVREATIEAQTKCAPYLENEATCRQGRESRCERFKDDCDGCQRLVVGAALAKAKLSLKIN